MGIALVIGGGAPNATFMAGVLHSFLEQKVEFDLISASGAGALVALTALAPKGLPAPEALENLTNAGVHDLIYNFFPVNYKVFQKPGTGADLFRTFISGSPFGRWIANQSGKSDFECFISDLIQFGWAAATPTPFDWMMRNGLCAPEPWITDLVDFDAVKTLKHRLEIVAYDVEKARLAWFHNGDITPETFRAALAFPFLYPTYNHGDNWYIEGATVSDVPYEGLFNNRNIDTVVVLDVLGWRHLIRKPATLWDAFTQLIVDPITANAQGRFNAFMLKNEIRKLKADPEEPPLNIYKVHADEAARVPDALTWRRSNLKEMFRLGQDAGLKVLKRIDGGHTEDRYQTERHAHQGSHAPALETV
jgi:predicted acylesterase/phospholipase RssA